MSLKLYNLGQYAFRKRWWVIGVWAAILILVVSQLALQGGAKITSAVTIDGTESERVIKELHEEFPEMSGGQGVIVFRSSDGSSLEETDTAAGLKALSTEINSLNFVAQRTDLRALLPGFQDLPQDMNLDGMQEVISTLPEGIKLSDYQKLMASMPDGVDPVELQGLFQAFPENTDFTQLKTALSQVPAGVDISMMQGALPPLPEGVDPNYLRGVLTSLPADVELAELQKLLTALPADVNLSDARTYLGQIGAGVNLDDMQTLITDLPAGTKISDIQAVADVPLLTVEGEEVPGMLLSADESTVMFQIQLVTAIEDLPTANLNQIIDLAQATADDLGVEVYVSDSLNPQTAPLGGSEVFGLLIAALVLILTLGSLRAAGLPLVSALVGVGAGLGGALALSHTIELTSATPVLALMVGLAVGIDYSLFIVNRTRMLMLREGKSALAATGQAVGTAGSAVVFAGLTVVIALLGLTLIGISFLTTMALVAAATVAIAVLVSLTLLPALLGVVGERLVSGRARSKSTTKSENTGFATRWAGQVISLRGVVTVLTIGILALIAVPAASMSFGMPNGATANQHTDERQAHDAISAGFGEGYNAPLLTVTKAAEGQQIDPIDLPLMALSLRDVPGVHTALPMGLSEDGTVAIVSVIPEHGPNSAETTALVHDLRDTGLEIINVDASSFGVSGLTAVNIDISEKLAEVLPIYITIIVVASLIILLLVFRSLLIPLKATGGFLLSIGATFGIITAVFQWGWAKDLFGFDTTGPILSFLPIMVTGILYGLAMDYEIFLLTSMRQAHVQGYKGDEAIIEGYARASRVVVAAAAIMVAVFAGFIFSEDPMVKQFGTALAVGIFIDAFVIRLTLIPAVMSFLGKSAWWLPKWMDRVLPSLDTEGHALEEHLRQKA